MAFEAKKGICKAFGFHWRLRQKSATEWNGGIYQTVERRGGDQHVGDLHAQEGDGRPAERQTVTLAEALNDDVGGKPDEGAAQEKVEKNKISHAAKVAWLALKSPSNVDHFRK